MASPAREGARRHADQAGIRIPAGPAHRDDAGRRGCRRPDHGSRAAVLAAAAARTRSDPDRAIGGSGGAGRTRTGGCATAADPHVQFLRRGHDMAAGRAVGIIALVIVGAALTASRATVLSQPALVRLAMVNVPDDVVRPLLGDFTAQSGRHAGIVYTGKEPFAVAREGQADLVISHYGHEGVEPFVTGGYGLWPHAVFANQIALIGPPAD